MNREHGDTQINFPVRRGDTFKSSSQNDVSTNLGSKKEILQERPSSSITINSLEPNLLSLIRRGSDTSVEHDPANTHDDLHDDKFSECDHSKLNETLNRQKQLDNSRKLLFVLETNGSTDCEFAFNIIYREFLKNGRILSSYLFDSSKDELYNYYNKKEVVLSRYETLLLTHLEEKKYKLIKKDKKYFTQYDQSVQLANELGVKNNANFLFCGFKGLKGPLARNEELEKGLSYLLSESRMPTVIIKEENLRVMKSRPQTGYKWLFVFDRNSSYSYKILPAFSHLLDPAKDTVDAMTLLPSFINFDDIKNNFYSFLENLGFDTSNSKYESFECRKTPSSIVIEKINFSEAPFYDFVVFYNNPISFKNEIYKENNDNFKIAMKAYCNVCFLNGGLYKNIEEDISNYI